MDFQIFSILSAIFITSCILLYKLTITTVTTVTTLPPGPRQLPIIGNLHQLGYTSHYSLHRLAAIYGPIMHVKLGSLSAIVISSPHLAKEILQKHDHLFSSRFVCDVMRILNHEHRSIPFLPVCPKWRSLRKALSTELFSHQRLDGSQAIRDQKVRQLVDHVRANSGKAFDIGHVTFISMINFLSMTLLSVDLADFGSGLSKEFRDLVVRALELVGMPNVSDFFPALRFLDLQRFRKENEMVWSRIIEIIGRLVDARQISSVGSKLDNNNDARPQDVLDSLLGENEYDLSTDDIKHLFADLFVAGTDTPAGTIEWAMTELLCNPDKMAKAQLELRSLVSKEEIVRDSDIPNLPYLQAVVKETLRLHPPAPFLVPHIAVEDVRIETFTVPKGSQVLVNVWSMGRDPQIWHDPERFAPERFLDLELDYKGRNFEFIPFGAGRRICPGMPLAHRMVHTVLASLIHAFDWELEKGVRPEDLNLNYRFALAVHKTAPLRVVPVLRADTGALN